MSKLAEIVGADKDVSYYKVRSAIDSVFRDNANSSRISPTATSPNGKASPCPGMELTRKLPTIGTALGQQSTISTQTPSSVSTSTAQTSLRTLPQLKTNLGKQDSSHATSTRNNLSGTTMSAKSTASHWTAATCIPRRTGNSSQWPLLARTCEARS